MRVIAAGVAAADSTHRAMSIPVAPSSSLHSVARGGGGGGGGGGRLAALLIMALAVARPRVGLDVINGWNKHATCLVTF